MSKHIRSQQGFSGIETVLMIAIVAIIVFVGWFVYHSEQKSTDTLNGATETSNSVGPKFSSSKAQPTASTASSGTSKSDLQSDLNGVSSASSQSNTDLSNTSSSLNDQSTFTTVPQ
jgi:hypothetical protein